MAEGSTVTQDAILKALGEVPEPALGKDLVASGRVGEISIDGGEVAVTLKMISPGSPYHEDLAGSVVGRLQSIPGVDKAKVEFELGVPSDGRMRSAAGAPIRNAIAVGSGKGGVGKSTVSVNLAAALAYAGAKVGLLDADVYGPNVPTMMGVDSMPPPQGGKMIPAQSFGVKIMSIAFLVKPGQPLIWRGPMLHSAIRQFIVDVDWGELDYLIVDLPPGTGDAPLSLSQSMPLSGSVIVTLPQKVSLEDAARSLEMFRSMDVNVFGVVENMSFLELPDGSVLDVFGQGGGEEMAQEMGVRFLGAVPMDPVVRQAGDSGVPVVISHPDTPVGQALTSIAANLALQVGVAAVRQSEPIPIQILD